MVICPKCSANCTDNQYYCTECGAFLLKTNQPSGSPQQSPERAYAPNPNQPPQNPPTGDAYPGNPNSGNPYQGDTYYDNPYYNYSETTQPPVKKYTFVESLMLFFKNYFDFSGRATHREYWYILLLNCVITILLSLMSKLIYKDTPLNPISIISSLYFFAVIIPDLSLTVRRLHDAGKSGITLLWSLLPFAGTVILAVNLMKASDGDNEYGPRKVEGTVDTH